MTNVTTLAKGGTSDVGVGNLPLTIQKYELNLATVAAAGITTGGYVTVLNIPADTYFRLLQVEVITDIALGGTARIDIGDSADDDEFVSNATTYTATTNLTLLKGDGSSGDVYTSTDSIRLKLTGDAVTTATGKIRFVWLQGDTTRSAPAASS